MRDYPVQLDVTSPPVFERMQLLVRIALGLVIAWLGITFGWVACVLFVALPVVAAVAISSLGGSRYLDEFASTLWRALSWLLQLSAYMLLLVDRFPSGEKHDVRINIRFTGRPTIGSALLRLITSIPSAFVLGFLAIISSLIWLLAAALVLVGAGMPRWILAYQRGVLRWSARLLAYHASLVAEYPPFSFDADADTRVPMATARSS